MPAGVLYLVPNLLGAVDPAAVLPAQVINVVRELDYYIAETPKAARAFLKSVGTSRPIQDIRIEALPAGLGEIGVERLLAPIVSGTDAGLISDAGVPAVADPGSLIVSGAHARGIRVAPLVGPSSLLLGLMASGLQGQRFAFHGYLPVDEKELTAAIRELEADSARHDRTQIFIETPYRNERMLKLLTATLRTDTRLVVATDLTLAGEQVISRFVGEWRAAAAPELKDRPSVFLLLAESKNARREPSGRKALS